MTMNQAKRTAILVTTFPESPPVSELERRAALGERPRKDYVELARALDADVVDYHYMMERSTPLARLVAWRAGLPAGQIVEAFWRRDRYDCVLAWADRLGFPLAMLYKAARSRTRLYTISVQASRGLKAALLRYGRASTHMNGIITRDLQFQILVSRLGVPREKLYSVPRGVDERFWRPDQTSTEDMICAVGEEARDYATLLEAVRGLNATAELAVGTTAASSIVDKRSYMAQRVRGVAELGLPANVQLRSQLSPREVRHTLARSRVFVAPVHPVEYDAGVTSLTEAMAMGKPVIATRTPGLIDLFRDREQGIFVPGSDPGALRTAIEFLLTHPDEAKRMGRAGRALVEERHTLDSVTERLARVVSGLEHPRGGAIGSTEIASSPAGATR
jgi:glycosyltransferase involved in cell wall biosynthesis